MKVLNTLFILLITLTCTFSQNPFERRASISDVVVEGEIIEKQSFWNANKSRIFTSNKIEITKIFKGIHTSATVEFLTVGGVIDNQFQYETHSFQFGIGQSGIFFLQNFTNENPFSERNLVPIQDVNFIPYRTNRQYFEAIDGEKIYTNPAKEIYSQLENAVGTEYEFVKNTSFENKIEEWLNDNLTFSTVTDNLIEFSFDNIVVNGTSSVDFDVYVKTNQQGLQFAASDVFVDYSHEAFGYSVVSNNNITGEKKQVIENAVYVLSLTDANSERLKIEVTSSLQPNDFYELSLYKEKFCHLSLNIQDVYELATMSFNESMMSDQSFFYDPSTGTYVPFDKIGVSNPVLPFALPQITSMSPNPITAGTGDILTITGTDFGDFNTQQCSTCRIKFADGDNEGFGEAYAQYLDIVSWTDTEIKVRVPSTTNQDGFMHPAASGGVWVERPSDLDPNIIEKSNEEDIHILYSVLNNRASVSPVVPPKRMAISNQTNIGITFQYASQFNSDIKNLFKNAVNEWCGHSQIAWKIASTTAPNNSVVDGSDNINLVVLVPQSSFSNPLARASVVISGHFNLCSNNLTPIYINDVDVKISNEYTISESAKWYNYILHELGHAHGLNHSKNPSISSFEEYMMNSLANNWGSSGQHSVQADDAIGANTCFSASQTILSDPACLTILPIGKHLCSDINPTYEISSIIFDFQIIPNPIENNELAISLVAIEREKVKLSLMNNIGQIIYKQDFQLKKGDNELLIDFSENLSTGIYYVALQKENSIITQKFIKL